jgi:hypothetical protein
LIASSLHELSLQQSIASSLLVVGFGGLIAHHFASSARPLSGFGALRFITGDAVRQLLAGLDHGLVSVLCSETLQQASEEHLR